MLLVWFEETRTVIQFRTQEINSGIEENRKEIQFKTWAVTSLYEVNLYVLLMQYLCK